MKSKIVTNWKCLFFSAFFWQSLLQVIFILNLIIFGILFFVTHHISFTFLLHHLSYSLFFFSLFISTSLMGGYIFKVVTQSLLYSSYLH